MLNALVKEYDLQEHIKQLEALSRPCVYGIANENQPALGSTKIGGFPHAGKDFIWPQFNGIPLAFLVQINLADLANADGHLPYTGILLFFYADGHWTDKKAQLDFIRVIYVPGGENLSIKQPEFLYKPRLFGLLKPIVLPRVFDEHGINLCHGDSLPDLENVTTIPSLATFDNDDGLSDSYCDLKFALSEQAVVQIGGYPNPVQYDDIAARAASIIGKGSADDWELLLEIDSKLGFMWGDAGRLYFYGHKDDLKNAIFSNVWMEFQCH